MYHAAPMKRYGMTIPLQGVPLHAQRDWIRELADLGYTDVWSTEGPGYDAFTPLALASTWAPQLRLGTAICSVYTRGPALLASCAATLAAAAPGRVVLGVGASSDVIVEGWNGIPFEKPYARVRDSLRFLRRALAGEKVSERYESFAVRGFRLGVEMPEPPRLMTAALRPGMLRLAGRESDGAILNWLSAGDVSRVAPIVKAFGADKEIVARIFVAPNSDADAVRALARQACAAYLNVPVYAAFHEWLGRAPALAAMHEAWSAGDRKRALAAIPDSVVDELIVHGPPEACREHIARYVANGVDTPVLMLMGAPDPRVALRALAPR
jgi:probable F420-dependent oxidoreductase